MKKIFCFISALTLTLFASCTNWDYIDGGLADDSVQGTMLEYLGRGKYDWSYADSLIRRGGLESLFDGKDPKYKDITFFGPTNHSIRAWLIDRGYTSINELSVEECRDMIMAHVLNKRIMRNDIPRGNYSSEGISHIGQGGEKYTLEADNTLWIHTFKEEYNGVPEAGAISIRILTIDGGSSFNVASSNIRCTNGVVHSLSYEYQFPNIK